MQLVYLVLAVCGARALDVRITGDVSFELCGSDAAASGEPRSRHHRSRDRHHADNTTGSADPADTSHHTTTTAPTETPSTTANSSSGSGADCKYKPPQMKQINALLSDMMNQITKVFVRLQRYQPGPPALRHHESRFKLVDNKQTEFFDQIFGDMIKEYMSICNESLSSAAEALRSPCANQAAVRALWSRLLDAAAAVYWRAARRCVRAGGRPGGHPRGGPGGHVGGGRVARARPSVRSRLLRRLCADYALCYPELK